MKKLWNEFIFSIKKFFPPIFLGAIAIDISGLGIIAAVILGFAIGIIDIIVSEFILPRDTRLALVHPPGARFLWLAEIIVSRKKFDQVCVPAVDDLRDEYNQALLKRSSSLVRLGIRIRHTWGFLKILGLLGILHSVASVLSKFKMGS